MKYRQKKVMYNSPFQNKIDLSLNLRHAHSFGQNKASCQISNSQTKKCPRATHLKFYIVITIWRAGQKWDLVITLTGGSYWPKTKASELHFARSFQGHPNWPYLAPSNARPNMPNMAKYAFLAQLHVLRESHVSSVSVVSLILDFKSNFPLFFCVCILLDFRAISPHKTKLYWPMNQWTMIIRTMMNWVVMDSW